MTIYEKLKRHAGDRLPMHMPGHKRRTDEPYLRDLCAALDITEIDGFDDLHDPSGIIADAEARAARLWGAENSHLLVGGSTVGILAGVYSLLTRGDAVIVARNCHKSVFHALEISGADAKYIVPETDGETGIFKDVTPLAVKKALDENPSARLVIITSPTYEGVISDVKGIARVAHERGVPLLVDEAHGAHLDLCDKFAGGAVKAGADVVIQSLHKTLPSLTQTAIAHVGGLADDKAFSRALDIFETSSPSYLLMASADGCVDYISSHPESLEKWSDNMDAFAKSAAALEKFALFRGEGCYGFDKSKIVISTANASISGYELMKILREKHGVELEAAGERFALAMTGVFDDENSLGALIGALTEIEKSVGAQKREAALPCPVPPCAAKISDAVSKRAESVSGGEAVGRVCAEYVYAYPPGVPLIVPGEIFTRDVISAAEKLKNIGARVVASDKTLKTFRVIENKS